MVLANVNPSDPLLGVMICATSGDVPVPEKSFCRRLCLEGRKLGLTVFVFSPTWVRLDANLVIGYTFHDNMWEKKLFTIPSLIYDRCYYPNVTKYVAVRTAIKELTERYPVTFLGRGLKGKWDIYLILSRYSEMKPYLPPTALYENASKLKSWVRQYGGYAFLKPHGGSHGKNTIFVRESPDQLLILARTSSNEQIERTFHLESAGYRYIDRWIKAKKYIMQPYLNLSNRSGEPFDIRALMQKNEKGAWELTGMAVRRGKLGSLTSNLHGGGRAEAVQPFLESEFGSRTMKRLIGTIETLSYQIPALLEEHHGRLAELGIDFGIDQCGNVWVLEVNSKPGRSVFQQMHDEQASLQSVRNPIMYARYLLLRQLRRVNS